MRTPDVHLNGTSAEALLDQYSEAVEALRLAIAAVQFAAPNGRDYYLQGGTAITEAWQEHTARIEALTAVRHGLQEITEHIQTQVDARSTHSTRRS